MDIRSLGWDDEWGRCFAPFADKGLSPARVALEDKHSFRVVGEPGEFEATVPGRLLHRRAGEAELPKVGDWLAVTPATEAGPAQIRAILPRRTALARKVAGRELREQVLVANVDVAIIVQALDQSYNLRRMERFLVMAHEGRLQPVVVLNKADGCDDTEARLKECQDCAGATPVLLTSARTGLGLSQVRKFMPPGKSVVFIGSSGVGKSSLINRLYGDDILVTQAVRESDAKGRHTTTWRELILLPGGGLVIDTPGMREFHLWLAGDGLEAAFSDVAEWAARCRFRDCRHEAETECAVLQAVQKGRLSAERLASYRRLRRELAYLAAERRQHTFRVRDKRSSAATWNARDALSEDSDPD
ncbi:MAG: ribosome small subunit-dependent GTPase A [Bryobacter sp.]|jgi:ribosome biogenesis GTPase|nr:ribosome small subunit-dependent GTPase A [Bryobacter sp.]